MCEGCASVGVTYLSQHWQNLHTTPLHQTQFSTSSAYYPATQEIALHPAVKALMDHKWKSFGLGLFR